MKAIIILDEDGGRVSCKYHDRVEFPNLGAEAMFEHKLFRKTKSVSSPTSPRRRFSGPLTVREGGRFRVFSELEMSCSGYGSRRGGHRPINTKERTYYDGGP